MFQEHRRNCERQGKYVEAEIAKNRLDELKLHEENRRKVRKTQLYARLTSRCRTSSRAPNWQNTSDELMSPGGEQKNG